MLPPSRTSDNEQELLSPLAASPILASLPDANDSYRLHSNNQQEKDRVNPHGTGLANNSSSGINSIRGTFSIQ